VKTKTKIESTDAAEKWLEPIRTKLKQARVDHDAWLDYEQKVLVLKKDTADTAQEEQRIICDASLELRFASKKLLEARATGEILSKRLEIAQKQSANVQHAFKWAIYELCFEQDYAKPILELRRRHWERSCYELRELLSAKPTNEQIEQRIPKDIEVSRCDFETTTKEGREWVVDAQKCVKTLPELESAFRQIEKVALANAEIFADVALDKEPEQPIDTRKSVSGITGPARDRLAGVKFVAATDLGYEGGRYQAGWPVDSIPEGDLARLIEQGHAIGVGEWRRRNAATARIENLSQIQPAPGTFKISAQFVALRDFQFGKQTYCKGKLVEGIPPEYLATLAAMDKVCTREAWAQRELNDMRYRQWAAA
jgi:hypothetical protein